MYRKLKIYYSFLVLLELYNQILYKYLYIVCVFICWKYIAEEIEIVFSQIVIDLMKPLWNVFVY